MAKQNLFKKIAVSVAAAALMLTSAPAMTAAQTVAASPSKHKTPARAATTTATAKKKAYSASAARARRATLAQARAATRARELKELQTPRFRVDEFGREVPDVRAEAAIIYNPETGEVLWENHSKDQRSMASITKVMTALVFLESNTPLSTEVTVQRSDVAHASTTYLRTGFKLPAEDLLNLLLVGSDNAAARALARVSNLGYDAFIQRMNEKAKELGLESTVYADPSGLLAANMSSAYDLARLIAYASADERISLDHAQDLVQHQHGRARHHRAQHESDRPQRRYRRGRRQDRIHQQLGYCLATLLRLPQSGQQVAFVVLGAKTNASRFWETRHLFNWMATRTKALLEGDFQQHQQQEQQQQLLQQQ
jgi:D-alanyl-D-alanine endopeptidase (penicillin-binding protein 7)